MTFSKTPPKLRLFWRDEAVTAPEPRKEDCITLKEGAGISHLPGFFLGVAKSISDGSGNMSKDLMLDRYQGPRSNLLTPAEVVNQHAGQVNIPIHSHRPQEETKRKVENVGNMAT